MKMETPATIRAATAKYRSAENLVLHSAKSPSELAIIANYSKAYRGEPGYSSRSSFHPILKHKLAHGVLGRFAIDFRHSPPLELPPSAMGIFARRVGPDALKPERRSF